MAKQPDNKDKTTQRVFIGDAAVLPTEPLRISMPPTQPPKPTKSQNNVGNQGTTGRKK